MLIDRALRDEGTSLHYLPPSRWSDAPAHADRGASASAFDDVPERVVIASTWTTDAPYRETAAAIARAASLGAVAVEMEAAALYAYAAARGRDVLCVAHVTNTMATEGDDFDKGESDGAEAALRVIAAILRAL